MKNRVLFGMTALIMLVCCLSVCAPAVQATEADTALKATIPVAVTNSGYEVVEDHVVQLKDAAGNVIEELTIKGTDDSEFVIEYDELGVYNYTVCQLPGDNERGVYDATVYDVTVFVVRDDNDQIVVKVVAIPVNADNASKADKLTFNNKYNENLTVNKLWSNDEKAKRPTSVTVNLIKDTEVVESVKLNDANKWTYTWTGLDADYTWSVAEVVPNGYKATYKISGETTTITNTYALIQTGQLNWPIVVFSVIGVLFLGFGAALLSRKKEIDA